MKKNLSHLTIAFVITATSFHVSAQNNKLRSRDNLNHNYSSARIPGSVVHSSQKNAGAPLVTSALSGFYLEDFEGAFPPAGWQVIDVLDPAYTWVQSVVLPYTGTAHAYIQFTDSLPVDGEDWLILPQFTVAATDSFSFWIAAQWTGFPPDSTFILVSTTDSLTTSFTDVIATLAEGDNYPATAGVYEYHAYDLSAYNGQDIYVAIMNKNSYGDGIFIDKVVIGTKPSVNAASVSIELPNYVPIGTMSPTATFLNDGISTQTFPVTMTITGGYTSTKNITNLAAGATQQVTFDPWTTIAASVETVSVQTQLTGDGYTIDDSIATTVAILEPFTNYGWISKAPMSATRFDAASAAINSNDTSYLYALAGVSVGAFSADAGEYLPYSNSWNAVAALNNAHYVSSAASFNNKIYVAGGYNPNFTPIPNMQVYDVANNSWSAAFPMPVPVGDYAFGIYHDSLFYYAGGYAGATAGDQDIVQIYNPATDTWMSGTSMPAAGAAWRGGIIGNQMVVSAGYNQLTGILSATYVGDIDPVNPTNITWSVWDDYPAGTNARPGAAASLDEASGLVIYTGGDPTGAGTDALDVTFAFDLNTHTWKIGPPKITGVNNLCNMSAIVDNDSLYIAAIGGLDVTGEKDVNEWLNLGPYVITTGIDNINTTASGFRCYPNPCVKFTDIKFSLTQSSQVKAVITDVMGKEIEELCNKTLNKGKQSLKWNAANYSKGVYFCKLVVNGKSFTQKLVKY